MRHAAYHRLVSSCLHPSDQTRRRKGSELRYDLASTEAPRVVCHAERKETIWRRHVREANGTGVEEVQVENRELKEIVIEMTFDNRAAIRQY